MIRANLNYNNNLLFIINCIPAPINQLKYSEPVSRDGSGTPSSEDLWRCDTTERLPTMIAK